MAAEHFDVLIVGAGISGIGAAWHVQHHCPTKSFALLEARPQLGGTWDLFRYPGIRSDSDMYTLGFSFKPWTNAKAIADAPAILAYLKETVREFGIDRHIRFNTRLRRADWSSDDARWTLTLDTPNGEQQLTCNFLEMCSGYYRYAAGYTPDFAGAADFAGQIIHPQLWPENLDYAGKKVVVIGSGATAVTLVPAMAQRAGHVTMLQRSPTYMVSRPGTDKIANGLRRVLPDKIAYWITRWKNVLFQMMVFRLARTKPAKVRDRLLGEIRALLGPDYDIAKHFTPHYNPWDERLCLVPDGDFFDAINAGKASIATDHIDHFTTDGIALKSGETLKADIIVTATGLQLELLGGAQLTIDGVAPAMGSLVNYKGVMFSGIPNLAMTFGYTNASWTLKADLTSAWVCRLINYMDKHGHRVALPDLKGQAIATEPFVDFSSGYFKRVIDQLPKQGTAAPWRLNQNYAHDIFVLRHGAIEDGVMSFPKGKVTPPVAAAPVATAPRELAMAE